MQILQGKEMKRNTFIGSLFGLFTLPVLAVKGLKPRGDLDKAKEYFAPAIKELDSYNDKDMLDHYGNRWNVDDNPYGKRIAFLGGDCEIGKVMPYVLFDDDIELKNGTVFKDVPDGVVLPISIDDFN
jgi:hypothetical protein